MKKLLPTLACALVATLCLAQSTVQKVPRWNGAPVEQLNSSCPTTDPHPEVYGFPPTGQQGQSSSVPGALHLAGCFGYRVIMTADAGQGFTSNITGGSVTICSWPEFPMADGGPWGQNPQLKETVPSGYSGQSITFAGHTADGLGWIYPAATTVSTLQPFDAGFDAGAVSVSVEATCGN